MNELDLFSAALDLTDPAERSRFLDEACGDSPELRQRIDTLLSNAAHASQFLEAPAPGFQATLDQPITEEPGTQIGPYKLLQQLGEGGMGVVYMAEQKEPVKRRVALKIIKPGMDTRQVIARFEAERQALAMMDHPNIAKVLDAGATESGRPYFVMELVNGLPVTKYCDQQHLTPKERLELFVPICKAVQHAHQKGIIHRDLKPSNILVALYDGQVVPKIIDFGVAKATSQTLTEKTMFTQLGQVVGTLEYMSPEQAERNQLDIDTRSDIYSLGVVLYELLTGDTPFDRTRLRSAAFDEMLRIIREEEPPRPSTKLSSSAALPSIAANRHIEPRRLSVLVRGELDWIVMKAIEKDRARRYETASKFAEDVQRYLNDEAVQACPPSPWYQLRKLVRKNRTTAALAGMAVIMLVAVAVSGFVVAKRAKDEAHRRIDLNRRLGEAVAETQGLLLVAESAGSKSRDAWTAAERVLERAETLAENEQADINLVNRVRDVAIAVKQATETQDAIDALNNVRERIGGDASSGQLAIFSNAGGPEEPGYAPVFTKLNIDPDSISPTLAAERVSASQEQLREALVIALDIWARHYAFHQRGLTDAQTVRQQWLRDVLTALDDGDPWRRRVRNPGAYLLADLVDQQPSPYIVVSMQDVSDPSRVRLRNPGTESQLSTLLVDLAHDASVERQPPHLVLVLAARLFGLARLSNPIYDDQAIGMLRRVVRRRPDDFWLNLRLASYLRQAKQDPDAVRFATAAVALKPSSLAAQLELARSLTAAEQPEEAETVFQMMLELNLEPRQRHQCGLLLGKLLESQGDMKGAIDAFRRAAECLPAHSLRKGEGGEWGGTDNAFDALSNLLLELQRYQELVDFLEASIEQSPQEPELYHLLGVVHEERQDWGQAADALLRVDELIAQDKTVEMTWRATCRLAWALHKANRAEESQAVVRRFCKMRPMLIATWARKECEPESFRDLVHIHATDGRLGEVDWIQRVEELVTLLPGDVQAINVLVRFLRPEVVMEGFSGHDGAALLRRGYSRDATVSHLPADRYQRAERLLREASEIDPDHFPTRYNLAFVLEKLGRHEEALAEYHLALELAPDNSTLRWHMARTLRAMGRHEDALPLLEASLERAFQNYQPTLRANKAAKPGEFDYRKHPPAPDWIYDVHDELVNTLVELDQHEVALENCRELIRQIQQKDGTLEDFLKLILPEHELHWRMGRVYLDLKEYDSALSEYREVLKVRPDWVNARYLCAYLLKRRGEVDGAIAEYRKTLGFAPTHASAHLELGNLLKSQGKLDEAIACYRNGIDVVPEKDIPEDNRPLMQIHRVLGDALREKGDTGHAIDAYAKAVQLSPDGNGPHNNLGLLLLKENRVDEAVVAFRAAVSFFDRRFRENPDDNALKQNLVVSLVNLAKSQLVSGDVEAHQEACRRLIGLFPPPEKRRAADWGHLGQQLFRAGQYQQARTALEKVIEMRGDSTPAIKGGPRWWYLAMSLAKTGESERAVQIYEQLAKLAEQVEGSNAALKELQAQAATVIGVQSMDE